MNQSNQRDFHIVRPDTVIHSEDIGGFHAEIRQREDGNVDLFFYKDGELLPEEPFSTLGITIHAAEQQLIGARWAANHPIRLGGPT